jgi:adenylate cyclase
MPRRRAVEAALAALLLLSAVAVALLLVRPPLPLAASERLFQSMAFRLAAPERPPHGRIALIGITEETLSAFPYRSPTDRAFLAGLVDHLAAAGVAAIGLDLLFDRPTEPEKDALLLRAVRRAGVPVVAISAAPETPLPPDRAEYLRAFLDGVRSGTANLSRDLFDDTVRLHVPVHPGTGAPSFPAALARAVGVPAPEHPFRIRWRRTEAGPVAPVYPAEAAALLPPEWLRGRVALVGSMVPGTDEHRSPASAFGRPHFGIEIHAQVLAQMLDGRAPPAAAFATAEVLATAGLAAAGLAAGATLAGWGAALALGGLALGWLALVLALEAAGGGAPTLPGVGPVLACLLAGGGVRAWRARADRRARAAVQGLFARFVSAPVAEALLRDRDLFLSGGRPKPQELTATVLFSDIAGFTGVCETLPAEPLIAWLDRYIDTMSDLIVAHGGVVLRFVGDGILAAFGVPVPRNTEAAVAADALAAARCALAMERAMEELNAGWRDAGLPEAGLRVGIHTGPMVAGSLGRGDRMEFCLLGDTANVGARLEQMGKQHGGEGPGSCAILLGEPTWRLLGGALPGRPVGELALRNRRAHLTAYRIDRRAVRGLSAPAEPPVAAGREAGALLPATLPLPPPAPATRGRG